MSQLVNELKNEKVVRIAPATPGLFNILCIRKIAIFGTLTLK